VVLAGGHLLVASSLLGGYQARRVTLQYATAVARCQ